MVIFLSIRFESFRKPKCVSRGSCHWQDGGLHSSVSFWLLVPKCYKKLHSTSDNKCLLCIVSKSSFVE